MNHWLMRDYTPLKSKVARQTSTSYFAAPVRKRPSGIRWMRDVVRGDVIT